MQPPDNEDAPAPANEPGPRVGKLAIVPALGVMLYAAAIYLPFLGARTLTSHEVMVSHPAMRMLEDGQWIVPHYASGLWLDKPPLVSWITAACFAVAGGFGEFAARLPAALSAIAIAGLVTLLAGRTETRRAALFAGLVQATCVYTYMEGRLGEIDMPFALFLTAAHGVLLWQWADGRMSLSLTASLLFHFFAALATLSKGAIAVVFVGLTILAYALVRRSWKPIVATVWTPGVVVFIVLAGGWHVAAYLLAGQEALEQWSYNSVARFFGLHHLGKNSFFFYFWTVPWLVLPGFIALPIGFRRLWRDFRRPTAYGDRFLWCWFWGAFAFLTICFFKHKHYIIPCLPPLSIFAGRLLDVHVKRRGVAAKRFYVAAFAVAAVVFGVIGGVVMPWLDHRRVTADFVRAETAKLSADARLYVIGLGQSSAYPYIRHENCVYVDTLPAVRSALRSHHDSSMWVLSLRKYLPLAEQAGLRYEETAGEPVRDEHPFEETVTIGRLTAAPPTSRPGQ